MVSAIVAKVTNDDDDYGNICIMVKCLYVCLSVFGRRVPSDNDDNGDDDDYGNDDDNEDNVCEREGKSGSQ